MFLHFASDKCNEEWGSKTSWYKIKKSWLSMFEYMHYNNGAGKTKNIRNKCCHEIFIASRGSLKTKSSKNEIEP